MVIFHSYVSLPEGTHYITYIQLPNRLAPCWKWGCWDVEPSPKAHARLYINGNKYHILGDQHPFRPSILMFTTGNYKARSHPQRMSSSFRIGKNIWIDIILYICIYIYISLKNGDFTWLSRNHQKKGFYHRKKMRKATQNRDSITQQG
jgi:hypothetical protein